MNTRVGYLWVSLVVATIVGICGVVIASAAGAAPPSSVPGPIEAEDYLPDDYVDSDARYGTANAAEYNDDVDVWNMEGGAGAIIGRTRAGEYTVYDITVVDAGTYSFSARVATGDPVGGNLELVVDGERVGNAAVSDTGGWWNWDNVALGRITLAAGQHTITARWVEGNVNFDRIDATIVSLDGETFRCRADGGAVTWTDAGADKYWLYRSTDDGATYEFAGRTFGSTTKRDPHPAVGARYQVHYAGIDRVDCAPASEPSDALLLNCRANGAALSWSDANADKYWIYRSTDGETYQWIGRTLGATEFVDPSPIDGADYQVHYAGIPRRSCTNSAAVAPAPGPTATATPAPTATAAPEPTATATPAPPATPAPTATAAPEPAPTATPAGAERDCRSAEDDGSLSSANQVAGVPAILCFGSIGDGPFGATTGDVDMWRVDLPDDVKVARVQASVWIPFEYRDDRLVDIAVYDELGTVVARSDEALNNAILIDRPIFIAVLAEGSALVDPKDSGSGTGAANTFEYELSINVDSYDCQAAEDDGSLDATNPIRLDSSLGDESIAYSDRCSGIIGDGPFGDSTGDVDMWAITLPAGIQSATLIPDNSQPRSRLLARTGDPIELTIYNADGIVVERLDPPREYDRPQVRVGVGYSMGFAAVGTRLGDSSDSGSGSGASGQGPYEAGYRLRDLSAEPLEPGRLKVSGNAERVQVLDERGDVVAEATSRLFSDQNVNWETYFVTDLDVELEPGRYTVLVEPPGLWIGDGPAPRSNINGFEARADGWLEADVLIGDGIERRLTARYDRLDGAEGPYGDVIADYGAEVLAGVTVEVVDPDGDVLETTTTDSRGRYLFDVSGYDSPAVRFSAPPGYVLNGTVATGIASSLDDSGGPYGLSRIIRPRQGSFVYIRVLSVVVDGCLWQDDDGDGVRDDGEASVAGLPLQLIATSAEGVESSAGAMATDSAGCYEFRPETARIADFFVSVQETDLEARAYRPAPKGRGGDSDLDSDFQRAGGGVVVSTDIGLRQSGSRDLGLIPLDD